MQNALNNINGPLYGWEVERNEDGEFYSNLPEGELLIAFKENNVEFYSHTSKAQNGGEIK